MAITPLGAQGLTELAVGPSSVLRLRGEVTGSRRPTNPTWEWRVTYPGGMVAAPARVDMRPDTVQVDLRNPGRYVIQASVSQGCMSSVTATAVDGRIYPTRFWIRATPPANVTAPAKENLMAIEILPGAGQQKVDIVFDRGTPVRIDPQRPTGGAIDSYIRVTSPASTVRLEGHNKNGVFMARLNPDLQYDVLVIPDDTTAPALFANVTPATIGQLSFTLDDGNVVSGQLNAPGGRPLAQARLLLRSGILPSTLGLSDANGRVEVRARNGPFGAVLVPPPGSGLPEAHIDEGTGLVVQSAARTSLAFTWRAIETATLELTVRGTDDTPMTTPVRVRLETASDALPDVGTLTVNGTATLTAAGVMRAEAITEGGGIARFGNLPRALYRAVLAPADDSAAITTVPIDLTGPTASVTRSARLLRKVTVSGRLAPATLAAGATVVGLDTGLDATGNVPAGIVGPDGRYTLSVAPGRQYRLFVEPLPARGLPRVALGTINGPAQDGPIDDARVFAGFPISGTVTAVDGVPVAGAVIQAYCLREAPECVNPTSRSTDVVRPVFEAVSGPGGAFRLLVPDPTATP